MDPLHDSERPDAHYGALPWGTVALFVVVLVFGGLILASDAVGWFGTEARRAVIGRSMLRSLDFILPTHGGEPSLVKPPLFYAMQAGAMALVGETRLGSRLPNLLCFALLALAFWRAGKRFGRRDGAYAILGALFVLTHPVLGQFAASAEIDGCFTFWIALSLFVLCAAASRRKDRAEEGESQLAYVAVSGLCGGLALLSKGPIGLAFLLPAFWPLRRLVPLWMLVPWLVCAALPTAGWVYALHARGLLDLLTGHAGGEALERIDALDLWRIAKIPVDLGKFVFLLLPVLVLPFLGARRKLPVDDTRRAILLALVYAGVGGVLIFCFAPHRPTRYLLPALPPLIFALVHGSGPWLDPRARLGLALDRPFDPDIDLETVKVERERRWRYGLAGLCLVGAVLCFLVHVEWLRVAPLCFVVLAAVALPWSKGPVIPLLGLGFAVQLFVTLDYGSRKSMGIHDRMKAAEHIDLVTGTDAVTGWLHVPSELAWVLGQRVIFDEFGVRPILTPWVVWEERSGGERRPDVKTQEVLRLRVDDRDLVLSRTR